MNEQMLVIDSKAEINEEKTPKKRGKEIFQRSSRGTAKTTAAYQLKN